MATTRSLKITLLKSTIGRLESHKACIRGLGLKKIRQTVLLQDTPAIRGMVKKVSYMLDVKE